jgi:hypothetical protein
MKENGLFVPKRMGSVVQSHQLSGFESNLLLTCTIDYVLSPAKGETTTGNWENRFFLNKFLFYSSLQLAKTLLFSRPWKKTKTFFFFLFHLKYFVKKICAPTHKKSLAL